MACVNDTSSVSLDTTSGILTAVVKISATGGNLISLNSDGLYAAGGGGAVVPTGTILDFAGSSAPTGYAFIDGSTLNRVTEAALFAVIGTTYGSGDGSTTFTLPDGRGRATYGLGTNADVNALNRNDALTVGTRSAKHNSTPALNGSHNLTLPNHGHSVGDPGHVHQYTNPGNSDGTGGLGGVSGPNFTDNVGIGFTGISVNNPLSLPAIVGSVTVGGTIGPGGSRPSDMGGFLVVNKIIKK